MLTPLLTVLPIFALVFAGWSARRIGVLGAGASSELNRFVVYLALPALLFHVVATARPAELWQPGLIATLTAATLTVFALIIVTRARARGLASAAIEGLNAAYSNSAYMGFPLMVAVFGNDARLYALLASMITVCALFAIAVTLIELSLQDDGSSLRIAGRTALAVARNPLVVAPALGAAFPVTGVVPPAPLDSFLTMLGSAAPPCALVGLGLFLAGEPAGPAARTGRLVGALLACKLVAMPALAWTLGSLVFRLPPPQLHAAVLLAALPTGTGPFMLAEFYGREAQVTARTILGSTVLSLVTITGYLWLAM